MGGYNFRPTERFDGSTIWDWLTTVDHKKIGILYVGSGLIFFLIGGVEALLIRLQLIVPDSGFVTPETYNQLMTMHGTTMIFLVAMPLLIGIMNYAMPLQIGARDVAFPFLNSLGFWLFFVGGLLLNLSWFFGGAPDAGWSSYTSLALNDYSPGPGVDYYVLGLQISGIGSLIGGINFIVTIVNMRAPGMTYLRMPLFTWTTFVTSALLLFAIPPLTVALLLLMLDRLFGTGFFSVALGGEVVIWEHLFWIFGHPEVYLVVLPVFGVFSDVISAFSKKTLFGYLSMVFATVLIGFIAFMVWVHHMFTDGLGAMANTIFGIATMAIAVPTGIKIFNWLFTMWGGKIRFTTAMLFSVAFIPTFVMGGVTGVMLAVVPADWQFHDSYFVVAHFHYVLLGATVLGLFSALYYWWPKMTGKLLNETWGKWHFWLFLFGFHLTFLPQHFLGLYGMPRRVYTYESSPMVDNINMISTIGSLGMTLGTIFFLYNIVVTQKRGQRAGADPWDGRTLEWTIPSPTPEYNFAQLPLVESYDPLWEAKMNGDGKVPAAEPLGSIHMPSSSYLPLFISIGMFVAGYALILHSYFVAVIGMIVVFAVMGVRSFEVDHGYHLEAEELTGSSNLSGKGVHGR
ncbi:cytochrome c oxidase subunit I [Mechercharimyces sp. CAU 1602]|uniref:cytochrome c oxidase subunit I n=1 Tax=Mechercharimyces sp. CAU 1602 TaxID=2973933 RepID=UPI002163A301|nr:cytochrome c oxidase subunit I [Mechercharimyces sp. CAU 1602]MCS1352762.1 cytochrome c oxidase subunit I [Mechercharimyces sp. CAU 1602]